MVSDIDEDKGRKVAEELNQKEGVAVFIKADTSKPEDCEPLVKKTVEKFGSLHFAINNTGLGGEQEVTAEYAVDRTRGGRADQTTALEYAEKGVRVNSVGPGYIETPLLDQMDEEQKKQLVQLYPIGRLGKPEEVANLVYWLCSDEASFVTGSYYLGDGGYTAQ